MNIFNENRTEYTQLEKTLMEACFYQMRVKVKYPNAKEMFLENERGFREYVGIFNAPISLNRKLQFRAQKQFSPHLIGGRVFAFRDEYHDLHKAAQIRNAWFVAMAECDHKRLPERLVKDSFNPYEPEPTPEQLKWLREQGEREIEALQNTPWFIH